MGGWCLQECMRISEVGSAAFGQVGENGDEFVLSRKRG